MNKGSIKKTVNIIIWVFSLFLVVITVIPLADVNEWWIRIFDFPRIQIAIALAELFLFRRSSCKKPQNIGFCSRF